MNPQDVDLLTRLLEALALAVVAVVAFGARQLIGVGVSYLKSKIGLNEFSMLKEFVSTVVRSLEQNPAFSQFSGEKKKEMAIVAISQWCSQMGITVDTKLIDRAIEEAVQIMNGAQVE